MKILKTRIILLIAALAAFGLVGCSRSITNEEIKNAEQICAKNGGLREYYINGFPNFNLAQILCNDEMRMTNVRRYKTAN